MKRRIVIAAFLVVSLLGIPAVAKVSVNAEGDAMRPTTTTDLMRHKHKNKFYSESWTTILQTADGWSLYVNFLVTNIGVIEGSSGMSITVTAPGQQAKHWSAEHKISDFSDDASKGMIKVGPNEMTLKGNKLVININDKGMALNVTMNGWYPNGYKFYDGKTYLNDAKDKYFYHFFHMPRGDFQGTMTWEGKTVNLKGAGYMDHMVNNRLTSEWSTRWWTVRYFTPDYTVAVVSMKMDPKFGGDIVHRAFFGTRGKAMTVTDQVDLETTLLATDSKAGHKYHTRYVIGMKGEGFQFKSTFQSKRLHDREGIIEELPKVQQGIAKMFAGNPITYRMEGSSEMTVTDAAGATKKTGGVSLMETIVIRD